MQPLTWYKSPVAEHHCFLLQPRGALVSSQHIIRSLKRIVETRVFGCIKSCRSLNPNTSNNIYQGLSNIQRSNSVSNKPVADRLFIVVAHDAAAPSREGEISFGQFSNEAAYRDGKYQPIESGFLQQLQVVISSRQSLSYLRRSRLRQMSCNLNNSCDMDNFLRGDGAKSFQSRRWRTGSSHGCKPSLCCTSSQ